ncbi:MAG: NADH oxidase [Deltaproteobacteria bacterium HGW-Deltaproteobacteria-15]|jgi:2,4-dienoyl-CoA reductase (NADPH2)|nr:MAG: NADH oxidase [Deltaproteobacteria bacterium HGW-Deltaproteobacteria-15]
MAKVLFEWDYSKYPGAKKYPHLFKPIQVGNLMVPNRIVYAATEDNLNSHDGFVTDADVAYIRSRAEGVVGGMCFMQGVYMDEARQGQGYVGQAAAWDDKFIPGLKRLADAIHSERAIAGYQLMDCGRVGAVEVDYGHGPSAVPQRLRIFRQMKEMSKDEIKAVIQQSLDAARRGLEAGFDVIEISGIVGYLVSNFISSYTNRRTDEYGGDIRGRMRMVVETIQGLKKLCGPDVPIGIRLCAEELLDDVKGNTKEESMMTYKISEEAGIDYISVTAGWQESIVPVISRDVPQGAWLHLAKRAKENVKVPIMMAYRLFDPSIPHKAIEKNELDMWEMCRPMIADPLMPKKVLQGQEEDIRWCLACNLCLARLFRDAPMTCYINPLCAHEHDPKFMNPPPPEEKKNIMIVGGGPAGLECAYVAAQRGHEVHVYDKRKDLGGTLTEASKAPYGDDELFSCITYQKVQCEKSGVKFHLGTEVTEDLIKDELPDSVVLATGPVYSKLDVPGTDKLNMVNVLDVLRGDAKVGENVVVWGNRKPGIGVALSLAKQGKKVTIVGKEKSAGFDINPSFKWRYMIYLRQNGIKAYNDSRIDEVGQGEIIVKTYDGYRFPVKCDTLVVTEREPNEALKNVVQGEGIELFVIGDALVPRNLSSAVHDGFHIGIRI